MNGESSSAKHVAVVPGGTGNVGENIVRAFLLRGSTVVVPSRTPERLDRLRKFLGDDVSDRLIGVVGDVSFPDEALRIRHEVLARTGRIDSVTATLGGWWRGEPLIEVPLSTWNELLRVLTSHFVAARTFIPELLSHGGSYTFINGLAAEQPWSLAGPVSVAAAGQLMLGRALALEQEESSVRVNELVLGPVMTRIRHGNGDPGWVTGEEVGEFVVRLAFDSSVKGKIFRISDYHALTAERANLS